MIVQTFLVAIPLVTLSPILPFRAQFRLSNAWCGLFVWGCRWIVGIKYRHRGFENLPDTPSIMFANHQSALEAFYLQTVMPPFVWILKRELLKVPFFGWGLASLRPIAINRDGGRDAVTQLIAQGKQRLADGMWVLVFPEGTRTAPGVRKKFKRGGAMLAVEAGVPVVPIAHNAGLLWPSRNVLARRSGTVDIVIGPPIQTANRTATDVNREVQEWIHKTMAEIGS